MIRIGMRTVAGSVKGQGVGSATAELLRLLEKYGRDDFRVSVNRGLRDCDVLHVHTIDPVSLLTMRFSRKPTVVSVHFVPKTLDGALRMPGPVFAALKRYTLGFYRCADRIHVVSPAGKRDLVRYGFPKDRIRVIPNVVSPDGFGRRTEAERKAVRERYGFAEKDFVVLGVGQIQTKKGVQTFGETAELLPEVKFVWAGGFSFGAMSDGYPELKRLMENPPENLRFTGIVPREEVADLLLAADLFFLPSWHEQCCMAVLEAAAAETPILLRDLSSYRLLYPGHYLAASDAAGFAERIRALREDAALYAEMSGKAARISRMYSEERIYRRWKEFYEETARLKRKENP